MVNTLNLATCCHWLRFGQVHRFACPFYPPNSRPLAVLITDKYAVLVQHSCWRSWPYVDLRANGAGKSTLLATLAAQFRCYKNARIYAFDKGMSMFPLCLGSGGTHYNIGNSEQLSFAPLQRIDSDAERAWAEEWIASLMELQQITVMPSHRNAIHMAMLDLSAQPQKTSAP